MDYSLYKGYILGPGEQRPVYDIYEVDIFLSKTEVEVGVPFHTSESESEAQDWIDRSIDTYGEGRASQQDVDELNAVPSKRGNWVVAYGCGLDADTRYIERFDDALEFMRLVAEGNKTSMEVNDQYHVNISFNPG